LKKNKNTIKEVNVSYNRKQDFNIKTLPNSLYAIPHLEELWICGSTIVRLSPKISQLKNLKKLGICKLFHFKLHIPHEIAHLKDTLNDICVCSYENYTGVTTKAEFVALLPNTIFRV
jgi:hypothetical protein